MTAESRRIKLPLNRVEGDLEIFIEIVDGVVSNAWSKGTLFRGFERMMEGRAALDGLVITPRICGICSMTHLNAAAEALDAITGIRPPDNARRLRNVAVMAETVQSDIRHAVLMFLVDFAHRESYQSHPLGEEAFQRYAPLSGSAAIETIKETKKLLGIVALIGGQWPHTSFMVPGGVTNGLSLTDTMKCRSILAHFKNWYERSILGCSSERWKQITTLDELDAWLDEKPEHRNSEVGFFIRFAKLAQLDALGRGHNNFISYGSYTLPSETAVQGTYGRLFAAGFAQGTNVGSLDLTRIQEDVSYSWFQQDTPSAHPHQSQTNPFIADKNDPRYSWIKAPRYDGIPAETGALAEKIAAKDPLFTDLVAKLGANVLVRQLARMVRPACYMEAMSIWLDELMQNPNTDFYHAVTEIPDGRGEGLVQAARGALGHWVEVENEKIKHYQIITPTAWNGSPRDGAGIAGAWEQALIGTPVRDLSHPIEAGHVIRSFDPCLVCAVHTVHKGKQRGQMRLGFGR